MAQAKDALWASNGKLEKNAAFGDVQIRLVKMTVALSYSSKIENKKNNDF